MKDARQYALIGAAMGWGARKEETEFGPDTFKQSLAYQNLCSLTSNYKWRRTLYPKISVKEAMPLNYDKRLTQIQNFTSELALEVQATLADEQFPIILGGDHSVAIGTWQGVVEALQAKQKFGLVWMDAHMDSHTPETTLSKAIHGMPVAALLGYGEASLGGGHPTIAPENLVLVGIRSYESGEANLLERLGVRVIKMNEIKTRGLAQCMDEAISIASTDTKGFGISLDLDCFDPNCAPGVGSRARGGFYAKEALGVFEMIMQNEKLKALEITEYNPQLDEDDQTLNLIREIMACLSQCSSG